MDKLSSLNFTGSLVIDKKIRNEKPIGKIVIPNSENLQDSSKIEEFSNFVVEEIYKLGNIYIKKSYGGRINIIKCIIKKLDLKTLFVCKNYNETAVYEDIFNNDENCKITHLIKLKINSIDLSQFSIIIFIDIIDKINPSWIDKKVSIMINNSFEDNKNIIDGDKFFFKEININIYPFDSKIFFDDMNKFIKENQSQNSIILMNKKKYRKLFSNFTNKIDNLMITVYDMVIEGFNIDNYDTVYLLDLEDKKILKQIIARFIKITNFSIE